MFQTTIHIKLIMWGNNFIFVIHLIYTISDFSILVNAKNIVKYEFSLNFSFIKDTIFKKINLGFDCSKYNAKQKLNIYVSINSLYNNFEIFIQIYVFVIYFYHVI